MNKITLRPINRTDAEVYRELRNDDKTYYWFFSQKKFTLEEVEGWITALPDTDMVFLAERDNQVIGTCSLYDIDVSEKKAEVGRIITASTLRGQGIALSMLLELANIGRKQKLAQLYASIKNGNTASQRLFAKAGYSLTKGGTFAWQNLTY